MARHLHPECGLVRTSYIRVGESPGVTSPSKSGAWVVDSEGFRRLLAIEIQKAQRLRYCVSLMCIAADRRSPEVEQPTALSLVERITPFLRSTDIITCWTPPSLALMLVDADLVSLPSINSRVTSKHEAYVWSAGGSCYPKTATHSEELLHQAEGLFLQAGRDGGSRLYLPN